MNPIRPCPIRRAVRKITTAACIALSALPTLTATASACENAMIVFDASGSMALFRDGRPKIDIARQAAAEVLPDVTRHRPTGLVTYSGGRGPACTDVDLRVAPSLGSSAKILASLAGINPNGATPLSDGVELAAHTLNRLGTPGIIVLVTDGLENCGRDACELAQKLKSEMRNIVVHVISFFLHGRAVETVQCLARITGGTYTPTNSLSSLRQALESTLACVRISTNHRRRRRITVPTLPSTDDRNSSATTGRSQGAPQRGA